jgi:hypothetical protein
MKAYQNLNITGSISLSGSFNAGDLNATASNAILATTASSVTTLNQPVTISGSFTVFTGSNVELQVTNIGVRLGNQLTDIHTITGSLRVSGSITGSLLGTSSFATTAVTASTTTLAYAAIGISAIPTFQNADMTPTLLNGSGITVGGNVITIERPGVYLLNASIGIRATYAEYAWVDASNNRLTGTNTGMSISLVKQAFLSYKSTRCINSSFKASVHCLSRRNQGTSSDINESVHSNGTSCISKVSSIRRGRGVIFEFFPSQIGLSLMSGTTSSKKTSR